MFEVNYGDVFIVNLSDGEGAEITGVRPAVVVSNSFMNNNSDIIQVVPVNSNTTRWTLPTHIRIKERELEFIEKESVIVTEQVRSIDKSRLKQKLGSLDKAIMDKVLIGLKIPLLPNEQAKQLSPIQGTFILNKTVTFEENYEYEFKDFSKSKNPSKTIIDTIEQYASGFLNSENGGRVLYGISDNRVTIGLKLNYEQKDELNRNIQAKLQTLKPSIDPTVYKIVYHDVFNEEMQLISDMYVFEFYVPTYFDKTIMHFTHSGEAYAKINGVNQKLDILQVQDWIKRRVTEELISKKLI